MEEYRKINHPYFVDKTFEISNLGNVKNIKTGNTRTQYKGKVAIKGGDIFSVGRLVALTFLAEDPNVDYSKKRVRHLDKNLCNNRVENLQWM